MWCTVHYVSSLPCSEMMTCSWNYISQLNSAYLIGWRACGWLNISINPVQQSSSVIQPQSSPAIRYDHQCTSERMHTFTYLYPPPPTHIPQNNSVWNLTYTIDKWVYQYTRKVVLLSRWTIYNVVGSNTWVMSVYSYSSCQLMTYNSYCHK